MNHRATPSGPSGPRGPIGPSHELKRATAKIKIIPVNVFMTYYFKVN